MHADQFTGVTVLLGVEHDVHGLLRWVERYLVRSAPVVLLGLALLGLGHEGVDGSVTSQRSF